MKKTNIVQEFRSYRESMNRKIISENNVAIKRLYSLDTLTYKDAALSSKIKEMLGLCASLVLRCDDCVKYHLEKCREEGVTRAEIFDIFAVGSVVAGTITIPHIRKALEYWEALENIE